MGIIFLIWIMIGQYFNTTYTISRLPTDISQCNITGSTLNQSALNYSNYSNMTIWTEGESMEQNITFYNMEDSQKE